MTSGDLDLATQPRRRPGLAGDPLQRASIGVYARYAERGRNAWWRYAACVALALLLAILIPGVLMLALMLMRRWPTNAMELAQDPAHPVAFFAFNGGLFLALLAGFAASARLIHGKRFGDIVGRWRWRDFRLGAALWSLALICATLADFAIAPGGFRLAATGQTPALVPAAVGALAVQTFAEEFVFRGYATQGLLLATRRTIPTAIVSGLLFGAMHIPNGTPQALSATFFGIVLAVIAMRTGGIAFTFGLHLVNNLFGAVIVASSSDAFHGAPALFSQNTPGLTWWDTAVGAIALAVVALGLLGRRRERRSQR